MEDNHAEPLLLREITARDTIPSRGASAGPPDLEEHFGERDGRHRTTQPGVRHFVPRKPVPSNLPSSPPLSALKTSHSQMNGRCKGCPNSTILHNWWVEAVYCVVVVASLLAIVATVYPYNGHPMPQWPYRLSINTLIEIGRASCRERV